MLHYFHHILIIVLLGLGEKKKKKRFISQEKPSGLLLHIKVQVYQDEAGAAGCIEVVI